MSEPMTNERLAEIEGRADVALALTAGTVPELVSEVRRLTEQRDAALAECARAEEGALSWADPRLPVPEWVGRIRKALGAVEEVPADG